VLMAHVWRRSAHRSCALRGARVGRRAAVPRLVVGQDTPLCVHQCPHTMEAMMVEQLGGLAACAAHLGLRK
jgi:hypothetical protein